jgi:hypothetical protein
LAPDQVAATRFMPVNGFLRGSGIDTHGDSFYHGALGGIEVRW